MAGIYVHVPFCRQACHYCDFHFSTNTQTTGRMVRALVQEAHIRCATEPSWREEPFHTLYLGGGTPSLLSPTDVRELMAGVTEACGVNVRGLSEVTLEANPEDLSSERLEAWREAGVSRLSIGIQSFHDDTLTWMNRAHTGRQAEEGVLRAHAAGFEAMTVDLIYGVPTQRRWEDDVARALALPVCHVSAYALTVEPRTVLGTRVQRGDEAEPSDSRAVEEYNVLCQAMHERGWHHYETSNWAAPRADGTAATALHNSAYWAGAPYLGLGPGAHGFMGLRRYANVSNNPAYLRAVEDGRLDQSEESLTEIDRYNELLMTGLRTAQGVHPESLAASTGFRPDEVEPQVWTEALRSGNLVACGEGAFRIPEDRWITGDRLAAELFLVS